MEDKPFSEVTGRGEGRDPEERPPTPGIGSRPARPAARRPDRGSKIRKGLLAIVILGGAIGLAGYLRATKPPLQRIAVKERVWIVETVPVAVISVTPTLKLYGEIVAGQEVELRPLVAGRVVALGKTFAEGGIVRKGDTLIEIDDFDYAADVAERRAQLAEAGAKLTQLEIELAAEKDLLASDRTLIALRERDMQRRERLSRRGAGSEKALDDARLALTEQRKQHAERRKRIAILTSRIVEQKSAITRAEVTLKRARRNLADTKLKAPFGGFLRDISTSVGKKVGINDRIARLINARRLEARFQISDDEYGRLIATGALEGRKATVIWRTRAKIFTYDAEIERTSGRVETGSGGVNLYAHIKSTDLRTVLRPGVFVEVRILDRRYRNVVRLPDGALHGEDTVYAVVGDRLEARRVTVVARAGNDVLLRGDLKPGDRIVATVFAEIGPGVKVEVR